MADNSRDDLKNYVDRLFAGHKSAESRELKNEVLGNLEARLADYLEQGLVYEEALSKAKGSLDSVDDLLPDRKPVYINRFRLELLQSALLYLLIAWLATIPARILPTGIFVNTALALVLLILGVLFLSGSSRMKGESREAAAPLNSKRLHLFRKAAWLIWILYMALSAVLNTLKYFGSNLWFGRFPHVGGPYQFALIVLNYALPLLTLIIPLLFGKACALAEKHGKEE